jgi:hypothetical protein
MKISGYRLREALRNKRTLRDVMATRFNETLWQFGDEGAKPQDVANSFRDADHAVAALEEAQQFYNQQVHVMVSGKKMTLARAIKLVGGAGRLEKMWRSAAHDTGRDRYSYREMTRKTDEEHAKRMVSVDESIQLAQESARFASSLRSAIAEANAREVEIENLSSDLVE